MFPFYNDEFQIVLSLFFYFEVILKSQESCKNSTTPAYLHSDSTHVSIWPYLLYHSLSVFVWLSSFLYIFFTI